ncbi:MAG: ATP-grasp domain-containing protein [Desulfobacteraceae bacterium]|jgi:acetyl/propionyl-CoA carboxylase alpha subunit/acetyl-CoA carboxylase carboxyltransferase component|nr:ATP-grasp domain-containing protein [Desulfobacteraceae bacterium]
MQKMKILVANRGEIAVRILRAAAELNIPTVAVYSKDDATSLHCRLADESTPLPQKGVAAYLNIEQILASAKKLNCTAIHPGYGFLAENAEFARQCEKEGIIFIGPAADMLSLFGDKSRARELAKECGIPVIPATNGPASLLQINEFFSSLGENAAIMVKALSGGGGRGMRPVFQMKDIESTYQLCQSEALAAFGNDDVYVEQLIPKARHIEVQVMGDDYGNVTHVWERECTLQRRNQKLMEIAPSPSIDKTLRDKLTDAAVQLVKKVKYQGLATVEFLVDPNVKPDAKPNVKPNAKTFYFLEVNPRLQVEHTVTEEVTGIDLVKTQIQIASGKSLADLGLLQKSISAPTGFAIQLRINMEEIDKKGIIRPAGGTLDVFSPPLGPGIRVDTFGYPGYTTNPAFDSLLAKLICRSNSTDYTDVVTKAGRALREFRIDGVDTNIPMLQNLLIHPDVQENNVTTRFVEDHIRELADPENTCHTPLYVTPQKAGSESANSPAAMPANTIQGPENTQAVVSPMLGTVVSISAAEGDAVHLGQSLAVVEAMKMHHIIEASISGIVRMICSGEGDTLCKGQSILFIEPADVANSDTAAEQTKNPDEIRPDLKEVIERHRVGFDEARPEALEKRRKTGQRTARENIADLVDPDSFIEYGALAVAAQRRRRSLDDLIKKSPADGLITGIGSVNGQLFTPEHSRCMVMSYDYTVMAGTQGGFNHMKTDRMLGLAEEWRIPLVLFAEGGGGRPGDVDIMDLKVAGLDLDTFTRYARLSGLVPVVGIVSGRCFAGNATLLGCSDVIIATQNSNIGMGGPAMIEGGGLGKCLPEDIGPVDIQAPNGVIDILVQDEAEAVQTAKKYLSYFQGPLSEWECADQVFLRSCIPENRLLAYDIRNVVTTLADTGSVLELRQAFGTGIITALIRIEGTSFGLIANNTMHLGGAIDADSADKASRFIQLCDAFDIPLVTLSDTPGFMVGPEAEKSAQVRHFARMFVTAAGATIPFFSVILRKGYGLGAMAMVGGGYHRPVFNISWPTGEFGGMGLEGAVRLGFKKELDAEDDPKKKKALFDSLVTMAYDHGKAINMASFLEIDDVIDPKETRRWIMRGKQSLPPVPARTGKKRPNIDTW